MANITTYLENKLLEHSLGKTSWTMPANTYAALYTVAPSTSGGGTELNPASATSYARQTITWGSAASGAIANSADIRFPAASGAGSTWGIVVAVGILDNLTYGSGNVLWFGNLSSAVTINSGDDFRIAASGLTIRLS